MEANAGEDADVPPTETGWPLTITCAIQTSVTRDRDTHCDFLYDTYGDPQCIFHMRAS